MAGADFPTAHSIIRPRTRIHSKMSVVGFDVGNDTSCVALARKRGIDVVMNKESKRETPAAINFGGWKRFLESAALTLEACSTTESGVRVRMQHVGPDVE